MGMPETTRNLARKLRTATREVTTTRHGWRRLLNEAITGPQRGLGMSSVLGRPCAVRLEVTNHCGCDCRLCPTGQRVVGRERGRMSLESYRRLVDQIAPHTRFMWLHQWGDPLLHPDVYEMIAHAVAMKIYVKTSSTLRDWDAAEAEQLVTSGLSELTVSVHGLSEETYGDYQPNSGMGLTGALDKVRSLLAAKERLGRASPRVGLKFVVTKKNEHEAERLAAFARELGVGYTLDGPSLNLRFLPYDRKMAPRNVDEPTLRRERLALIEEWLPTDERYAGPYYPYIRDHDGELPPVAGTKWTDCAIPWREAYISWDGDVNLCCATYERRHRVGNVFERPLGEIWNNAHFRAARRDILGRRRGSDPSVLCHECRGRMI